MNKTMGKTAGQTVMEYIKTREEGDKPAGSRMWSKAKDSFLQQALSVYPDVHGNEACPLHVSHALRPFPVHRFG